MSTFQGEFDFGVPQFQLVFQPMLIAFAAGIALVTARIWAGRGGALVAVAFFLVIRGLVAIFVGPVMGEVTPHFPLYIVEGVLVEGVALLISTRRPIAFGAVSGLLIGTVGFAAEYAWSHVWMPLPWTASLLPEGLIAAVVAGLVGGLLGSLIGAALASDRIPFPRGIAPKAALAAAFVGLIGMVGYGLRADNPGNVSATVKLADVPSVGAGRHVSAQVRLTPRDAAKDAKWLMVTAWQGKDKLVVDRLKRVGPGVYTTTEPIPVGGSWKTMLRLHRGDQLLGMPLYMPEDTAIPAKAVPASAQFTRPLTADKKILQREAKSVSGILPLFAYLSVLGIALMLCAAMVWGLRRLARDGKAGMPDGPAPAAESARGPVITRREAQPAALS
jgi:hypothetical protein